MTQVYHIAAANVSRAWLYVPIAIDAKDAKDAELVDVRSGPLRPARRTAGTAVPGFRSRGYTVLLCVAETDAFVNQLHGLAGK